MGENSVSSGILRKTIIIGGIPLVFLYVVVPALFFLFPHFMQHVFFLNFVKVPFLDYKNLTTHGVKHLGRPFYLQEKGAKVLCGGKEPVLGVWHILPKDISNKYKKLIASGKRGPMTDGEFESLLSKGHNGIVVYFHGNSFDRTNAHRTDLYNRLADMNFHVLAIDYRGYGDSTGSPSEDGLIEDAHFIYNYAREKGQGKNIYIWGHSMGTGVASRFVAEISEQGIPPAGTILESPFNNIHDVVKNHPFSRPFRWLGPLFDKLIIDRWVQSGLVMRSDQSISHFKSPILILHAADDHIIPIQLGKALAESAKKAKKDVKFVEFEANLNLRHKFIHRAPHFIEILTEFFNHCETPNRSKYRLPRQEEVHINQ